jgi:peptidoglycan/xylan/chitin deacetylase (PgdA/CDA1 family)
MADSFMKLIISHDVDVLQTSDHLCDLLMVKQIIRNLIEYALGYATSKEFFRRFVDICNNRIHKLDELIAFDRENGIPSTFFFGMANGMYLNYSKQDAAYWVHRVKDAGLSVGVHGVDYENPIAIQSEHDTFKNITGMDHFGIRMHYLRMNESTLQNLEHAEYVFDSSVERLKGPYKIGRMWEFPLHIMDASIFYRCTRWINTRFEQAKTITTKLLEKAHDMKIPYFTINLHDPNFSPAYSQIYKWYIWLVQYAKDRGIAFTDFFSAVNEMEKNSAYQ